MADLPYTIEEFTASDGYRWRYRRYLPPGPTPAKESVAGADQREAPAGPGNSRGPTGAAGASGRLESLPHVVALHGIQSHAGWYEYSCTRLAQAGFTVSFLDRRGSGLNQQDRGDTPSFKRLLDDVAEYLSVVRGPSSVAQENLHGSPQRTTDHGPRTFLLAISWGGKLALALPRRHPGLVEGLVLLCPGLFPQVRLSLGRRLAILFSRCFRPRKQYPIPLNDPRLFTETPRWLEFLRTDPLALHEATARFLFNSARLDRYVRRAAKHVKIPVLLLLAERDRIINNARTRQFIAELPPGDRRIIEYPGAHHTLEFEPEPDRFIADIATWLDWHGF